MVPLLLEGDKQRGRGSDAVAGVFSGEGGGGGDLPTLVAGAVTCARTSRDEGVHRLVVCVSVFVGS